jgi:hypothetical protein
MKKLLAVMVLSCLSILVYADDGGYTITGDTLHPVNIIDVSMDYERLILRRHGPEEGASSAGNPQYNSGIWEIEVYIESVYKVNLFPPKRLPS